MSFQAKDSLVLSQQLRVQELVVSLQDPQLQVDDSGDLVILVREPIERVVCALHKDDSGPSLVVVTAANTSIVDSTLYTAGGDRSAIRLESVALATNDCVIVKYIVQE